MCRAFGLIVLRPKAEDRRLHRVNVLQPRQDRCGTSSAVCENGENRFTRALYGSYTDWRLETSDRPVFAVVKKGHHRNIRFVVNDVPLDSTDYCRAEYKDGLRRYLLRDRRW